jgi:cell division GTPase FtsZ
MAEIADAARVITEHIDPEAKVIFGAVMDDKIKKGEIKITVVASGFNTQNMPSLKPAISSFRNESNAMNIFDSITPMAKEKKPEPNHQSSSATLSSSSQSHSQQNTQNTQSQQKEVKELVDSSVQDDEMFDIPAFIRRKMK